MQKINLNFNVGTELYMHPRMRYKYESIFEVDYWAVYQIFYELLTLKMINPYADPKHVPYSMHYGREGGYYMPNWFKDTIRENVSDIVYETIFEPALNGGDLVHTSLIELISEYAEEGILQKPDDLEFPDNDNGNRNDLGFSSMFSS